MKRHLKEHSMAARQLMSLALIAGLALPMPAQAASVALATSPLATSTTSTVKPNLLFVLDNSGSMDWDHMPDDNGDGGSSVSFNFGYYGYRSNQCNQVYFNPATTYLPPVDASGTAYADSSFSNAESNGFNTSGSNVDLRSNFKAVGEDTGYPAYYYNYAGAQDTQQEKNYHSTTSTFFSECGSAQDSSTGLDVFTKVSLSATATTTTATIVVSGSSSTSVSGIKINGTEEIMYGEAAGSTSSSTVAANIAAKINLCTSIKAGNCTTVGGHGYTATVSGSTITLSGLTASAATIKVTRGNSGTMTFASTIFPAADSAKLTNFANWYSFYRTRMLMMKTAAGRAFSSLNNSYRVGLMKISQTNPVVYMNTFEGAHRTSWYNALYGMSTSGSTPLRRSFSDAGRYYAGKLSGTDPVQYSCQQNFTILSTDGYWNAGDSYKIDGSTVVDNQDGAQPRPYYDGSDLGLARSTRQTLMTQTQTRMNTSQPLKRIQETLASTSNLQSSTSELQSSTWPLLSSTSNLQRSSWSLQSSTSNLQSTTWTLQSSNSNLQSSILYLQKSTKSGGNWGAYSGVATCTWGSSTRCRYVTALGGTTVWTAGAATWTNAASCTSAYSTATTNGTVWSGNGTRCQYSAYSTPTPTGSCTIVSQDTTSPHSVPVATTCSYNATPSVATVTSCTPVTKTTSTTNGTVWNASARDCSYAAYSAPAPAASCTYQGQSSSSPYSGPAVTCSYNATPTVTNVTSCSTVAKTTSTTNGTVWEPSAQTCAYAAYTAPAPAASCTYQGQSGSSPYTGPAVSCSYGTTQTVANVSSCTPVAKTTSTVNGTVWDPTAKTCGYAAYTAPTNVSSCTDQAQSASAPYSGPATICSYTAYSGWFNVDSCTETAQDATPPYDMTASNGVASQCQTLDSGWTVPTQRRDSTNSGASYGPWYDVASCTVDNAGATQNQCQTTTACTPTSSTGYSVTCQTATTAPVLVSSCTPISPSDNNGQTTTSCVTSTITAAHPVASCTDANPSVANNYVRTTCTTASSGPTADSSCTPVTASEGNNWTSTTCSSVVTGGGTSNNLADIAMYYYQTDLRTPSLGNCGTAVAPATVGPLCENNVFIGGNDNNTQQHMTSFTLGLGASGRMNYSSSYQTDTSGDYYSVKLGSTASSSVCTWQSSGTTCNWPFPGMTGSDGLISNIDDLWHAAVNGRGAYFSATDPASLSAGLSNALAGINARKGSAAAAATSTLNPVAGNNSAYVASYTTVIWKGNLEARGINTDTGAVNENATWCVENVVAGTCASPGSVVAETVGNTTVYYCITPDSVICTEGVLDGTNCKVPVATACTGTMNSKVGDVVDTRVIKTANSTATGLVNFTYANLTAAQQAYFGSAHISTLSQWPTLDAAQRTAAAGANLVNYLRGQYGYEDRTANPAANRLYRYREAVLGDALESQPAFIGRPVFSYPYPGYDAYKSAQSGRSGTVYMGANDGMMHAFAADTGIERWAYVPSMVIPNMWKLADTGYATAHRNFVNGSPITSDVCVANCGDAAAAVWKTILVAGLNGGGRGYFALDITTPDSPALLWEFTPSTGSGNITDDDLGYSFGQPVITRKEDGTWVVLVTSGYNNTSPGNGEGYLYVLNAGSGAIISKIATNVGSATTPSGLARIAGWNNEAAGNLVGYVYGGDLLGNVWRFDVNSSVAATVADGEIGSGDVMKFASLYSDVSGTAPQPITTTPILGKIDQKRVVYIGTGKYLETSDLTTTQPQSLYAIMDNNATTTFVNPRNTMQPRYLPSSGNTATRYASAQNGSITDVGTVDFSINRGWFVDFPDSGERVNIDGKLIEGTLLVPTIVPSNTVCAPGGYGWLNFFNYKTGGAVDAATGLASIKYDATIVGVNVLYVNNEPKVGVVTSTNPTPELNNNVVFEKTAAGFSSKRVLWRELIP